MKIIDKQTIRIPSVLSVILIIFSINIFLFFSYYRQNEFYAYLESTAINIQKLIVDEKVSMQQLNNMEEKKAEIYNKTHFMIYDSTGIIIYKSKWAISLLNQNILQTVLKQKLELKKNGFESIIFTTKNNKNNKTYIIQASGYDLIGFEKQKTLLYFLILCTVLSIIFIAFTSRYYIRNDLKPIENISKRMKEASSKNLQFRFPEADLENEIGDMAHTFNQLLDRLSATYKQQQNFVSYATHELRTPLSILLGNAQVTLMKERTLSEYKQTIENFQYDINSMINLVNNLLELARMNADSQSVPFNQIRVDEVLWIAVDLVNKKNSNFKINIEFGEISDDELTLLINGNADLLALVFRNLIENGCKYSNNQEVLVKFESNEKYILISFIDKGIGLANKELKHIFEVFYRTQKNKEITGHGIGLPLSKKIVEIHSGEITVHSSEQFGTIFQVKLPNISK